MYTCSRVLRGGNTIAGTDLATLLPHHVPVLGVVAVVALVHMTGLHEALFVSEVPHLGDGLLGALLLGQLLHPLHLLLALHTHRPGLGVHRRPARQAEVYGAGVGSLGAALLGGTQHQAQRQQRHGHGERVTLKNIILN